MLLYLSIYLLLLTRSVWNIVVPESYNFVIYKKIPEYIDTFVTTMLKPKLATCDILDCIRYIFFKGTLTKKPAIYSYFSAPVLNKSLFFANSKRLPLFVNQIIVSYLISKLFCFKCITRYQFVFKKYHFF